MFDGTAELVMDLEYKRPGGGLWGSIESSEDRYVA